MDEASPASWSSFEIPFGTFSAVTVTLLVGQLPDADCGGATPQVAAPMVTTVELQGALGSRQVRDGASA